MLLPIEDVEVDPASNMRTAEGEGLRELAESMRPSGGIGQLQAILVVWTGERFKVVAGFRRLLAMKLHQKEMGFTTIKAIVIDPDDADLARLAENLVREDPTSFSTCRYIFEMATGAGGRRKRHPVEIAEAIGKSRPYVSNLIRFYRWIPDDLRAAWEADREGRFSFRCLNELTRLAQTGDLAKLQVRTAELLGVAMPSTAPIGIAIPREKRSRSRLGPRRAASLAARLEIGDRLQHDDRGELVRTILRSVAGLESWRATETIVNQILDYVGPADAVTRPVATALSNEGPTPVPES